MTTEHDPNQTTQEFLDQQAQAQQDAIAQVQGQPTYAELEQQLREAQADLEAAGQWKTAMLKASIDLQAELRQARALLERFWEISTIAARWPPGWMELIEELRIYRERKEDE